MAIEFDRILPQIGEFGRYQKFLFYLVCIPATTPAAFLAFNQLFILATPQHWCAIPELIATNASEELRRTLAAPLETRDGTLVHSQCRMYDINWTQVVQKYNQEGEWMVPNKTWLTVPCRHGWEYDHSDYDATLVTELNLVCRENWKPSTAMAAFNVGSLCGTVAWGWVADRWGRRCAFFLILLIGITCASASAFTSQYVAYTALRAMVGFTYPAIFQVPFIIVVELTGPSYRTFAGMMTCLFIGLAEVVLAALAYLLRDWFKIGLATSLPFLFFFGYWWFLPESPRWLLTNNRIHEAEVIVQRVARINGKTIPSNFLKKQQNQSLTANGSVVLRSEASDTGSVLDLIRTPNMRKKTMLIIFTWSTNSVVYTGLSLLSTGLGVNDYLGFLTVGGVEVPAALIAWKLMDISGRRWTLASSMLLGGLACVSALFAPEASRWVILSLAIIGKLGISSAFCVLYVFAGELFPTTVRARGIGISTFAASVAMVSSPYIVYLATHVRILPLVIMGVLCVAGSISAIFLPETLHCHLPETLAEGEEFGYGMKVLSCPRRKRKYQSQEYYPTKKTGTNGHLMTAPPIRKVVIDDSSESDESCI